MTQPTPQDSGAFWRSSQLTLEATKLQAQVGMNERRIQSNETLRMGQMELAREEMEMRELQERVTQEHGLQGLKRAMMENQLFQGQAALELNTIKQELARQQIETMPPQTDAEGMPFTMRRGQDGQPGFEREYLKGGRLEEYEQGKSRLNFQETADALKGLRLPGQNGRTSGKGGPSDKDVIELANQLHADSMGEDGEPTMTREESFAEARKLIGGKKAQGPQGNVLQQYRTFGPDAEGLFRMTQQATGMSEEGLSAEVDRMLDDARRTSSLLKSGQMTEQQAVTVILRELANRGQQQRERQAPPLSPPMQLKGPLQDTPQPQADPGLQHPSSRQSLMSIFGLGEVMYLDTSASMPEQAR